MQTNIQIRPARMDELHQLNALIQASSNGLGAGFYTAEEIAGLNTYVFGVDTELVEDQTYLVMEVNGEIAACGGWSKRRTLFGGDQSTASRIAGYLEPATEPAKIRAFFIHPKFARQGLGSKLLSYCETQAKNAGFSKLDLMSTMPGVPFYSSKGYIADEMITYMLPNGVEIRLLPMWKPI